MVRIGLIGTGLMGRNQAAYFKQVKGCAITACCDVVPGRAAEFAAAHGIPAAYDNLHAMLDRESFDGVTIVTPDNAHFGPAMECINRGIPVLCEKPLSDNLQDAIRMTRAAEHQGLITAVNFSYRNSPATQKAAALARAGKLGRIMHIEGRYLQSWLVSKHFGDWKSAHVWLWRLSKAHGSMGCLGDIGVHLFDMATFIAGDVDRVACELMTFDKGLDRIGDYVFDANDSFVASVHFANGAMGSLHSSRWATGHINSIGIRIHGDKGALDLDLSREPADQLRVCMGRADVDLGKWKSVKCPSVPNMYQRFVTAIRTGVQGQTSFAGALKVQACLQACFDSAEKGGFAEVQQPEMR